MCPPCDPECVLLFWLPCTPAALTHSDRTGSQAKMNSSRCQVELRFDSSLSPGEEGGLLSHSCCFFNEEAACLGHFHVNHSIALGQVGLSSDSLGSPAHLLCDPVARHTCHAVFTHLASIPSPSVNETLILLWAAPLSPCNDPLLPGLAHQAA